MTHTPEGVSLLIECPDRAYAVGCARAEVGAKYPGLIAHDVLHVEQVSSSPNVYEVVLRVENAQPVYHYDAAGRVTGVSW